MANDRFYIEKYTPYDDYGGSEEFELLSSVNDFEAAVDLAADYIVRRNYAESLKIIAGDVYGPDETVARLEDAAVAENAEAHRHHADLVLTIDVPASVPREFVERASANEVFDALIGTVEPYEVQVYPQMRGRNEEIDDASKRYQMLELAPRPRGKDTRDEDYEDPTAKRFSLLELDDDIHVNPRRKGRKRVRKALTKKGERYYRAVLTSTTVAADAQRRAAKQTAARAVVRAAQRGVPGLVRKNPPRVYRAQKVVAKLEKDARPILRRGAIVSSPAEFVQGTLADYISGNAHESFVIVYIDARNRVVGFNEYTSGGIADVEVNVSGIMRDAIASGAAAYITAHNHPTGDPSPSESDRALWRRLREASKIVGIACLDNLVIGEDGRYSSESEEEAA